MRAERTVLISGTSKGVGQALAKSLLDKGHAVIGISRTGATSLTGQERYTEYRCDLSDAIQLEQTVTHVLGRHRSINALVCNAGAGQFRGLEEFSSAQILHSIQLNLLSHMLLVRHCLPILQRHPCSDVVFIGSESALKGQKKGTLYCAAKFGVRGFAQALRQEVSGRGVRVSIIHPGMLRTPFFDTLDFEPGPDERHAVRLSEVCHALNMILDAHPSTVFDEIVVRPLQHVIAPKK